MAKRERTLRLRSFSRGGPVTRVCRYPAGAVAADYACGLCGIVLTAAPLFAVAPEQPVAWILAAAFALFLVYFVRAVVRHLTRIEWSESGLAARGPFGQEVSWDELHSMKLRHYTTKSDRTGGWMQLDLGTQRASIRIDSRLDGFAEIAQKAVTQLRRSGRSLDEPTLFNLSALGVPIDRDG